jgi:hypothetical protein
VLDLERRVLDREVIVQETLQAPRDLVAIVVLPHQDVG